MNSTIQTIGLFHLGMAFIPVILSLYFIYSWSLNIKQASYALSRMLIQLLLIGYILTTIFYSNNAYLISAILLVMIAVSCWIALRTLSKYRITLFKYAFIAIFLGGGITLAVVSQLVLTIEPWYQPQLIIPLAGMVFANAMNSISLSIERLYAELKNKVDYQTAKSRALNAATIPIINSMFAVGLVSLPGMMTGQILSGVSPLIAARYQIVIMCMLFSSGIISSAVFLLLAEQPIKKPVK